MPAPPRFTDDEIRAIRADERSYARIGEVYGCSAVMVWKIKNRHAYRYVD